MANINPYLTFNGNCEEAFNFYKSVFGGDFPAVMRMGDTDCGIPIPDNAKNLIMHIALPISDGSVLMGSDTTEGFGPPVTVGTNLSVAIGTTDEDEARKLFDGLSAGGLVTMPFDKAFWGALFGMFTDKFGIQWMVNCDLQEQR
jgi:PhnB protein